MIFVLLGDMGDQIVMLPAVVAYWGECGGRDACIAADARVRELIPAYPWLRDVRELPIVGSQVVVALNVWRAVERFGKEQHPTRMFYRCLGLGDPGEVVKPEIVVVDATSSYDFVIAPIAADPVRSMPAALFAALLGRLCAMGSVCVLGMNDMRAAYEETGATFLSNGPLPYVAGLMRNAARAVIAVDSMPSRLAHAVGVKRHVLLCADVVPAAWAGYPGVRMLYGAPASWTADAVSELLAS